MLNTFYIPPPAEGTVTLTYNDVFYKNSIDQLKSIQAKVEELLASGSSSVKYISEYGMVDSVVEDVVAKENVDLIVMGTQGASGLKEVFVGSNTSAVIGQAGCPVIIVPENARWQVPKKILFATDYKELSSGKIIDPVAEIANKYKAEIMILNVVPSQKETVSEEEAMEGLVLDDYFESIEHSFHLKHNDDPEHGIDDFAHEHKVEIIAMVKRKHSFFGRIFHKSITKKMVYHTDIPLLIIPEVV